MSVFLTKNAPGLRTSPVKRGYWVVKTVLGEHIPPPPAAVPELPRDEAKLDLPLRDLLARHRENKACASCHSRFDSLGLVFEGYGMVGERRSKDLSGRAVDDSATFPGGATGAGIEGLRAYVRAHRQDDFVDNLSRKLLSYALGRSLMLSDDIAVDAMRAKLVKDAYRFDSLIESIVTSSQFRNKRGGEELSARRSAERDRPTRYTMTKATISRRTVLRGLGVTMALPWLESMAWANPAQSAVPGNLVTTAAGAFPKRFGVLFMGNGINGNHWWARGQGAEMKLGKTLAAARAAQAQDQRHQRPLQPDGRRHRHPPRADGSTADRRQHPEGRHREGGHLDGSGARQQHRTGNAAGEHRARVRAADDRATTRRTSRWRTARTSRGRAPTRRCRTRCTRRSRSTACSRIAAACATRASSIA